MGISNYFEFIKIAEKLKTELRHSWTSDTKRQESVAEHSWFMGFLAVMFFGKFTIEVDQLKVMKLIVVHDLGEAIVGDRPAWEKYESSKFEDIERQGMIKLCNMLEDQSLKDEIWQLWLEFEDYKTNEAKVAKALDKIEVLIQHYLADISTWDDNDYKCCLYVIDEKFDVDPFVRELKDFVDTLTVSKIKSEGDFQKLRKEDISIWNKKHPEDKISLD
jgi:putative hydrolases of HD superfamily